MSIFTVPTIETERFILRPLTVDDAEAVFAWAGDERVNTYMPYNTHRSPDDSRMWLESLAGLENEYQWGFVRKSDNLLIGSGGMRYHTDTGGWTFGYNIRYDCWGKGYTTEITKGMIEFIQEKYSPGIISGECAVENTASARVMEKCGLTFKGYGEYSRFDGSQTYRSKVYELKAGGNI